jgi:hypothetical protein
MRGLCPRAPAIYRITARMVAERDGLRRPDLTGRWDGAPVASLRSRILRPGSVSI